LIYTTLPVFVRPSIDCACGTRGRCRPWWWRPSARSCRPGRRC